MNKSIFSYDKEKNCAYCAYGNGSGKDFVCAKASAQMPCEQFRYDVFKRQPKPKRHPAMQRFESSDFEL